MRVTGLVKFFKDLGLPSTRIGFEAEPLSQWLHAAVWHQVDQHLHCNNIVRSCG